MNRREAFNILGLSETATKDEINAAFRKLAKEHHPDKNPNNPDAESKFKEINSAYQLLQKEPEPDSQEHFSWGNPFQTIFTSFFTKKRQPAAKQPPTVDIKISFNESVLGCDREIEYDRFEKCINCDGNGVEVQAAPCKTCNGNGFKHANFQRGNVKFMSACSDCDGSGHQTNDCDTCNGNAGNYKKSKLKINLPGGLQNQQIVRVSGGGHFASSDFLNLTGYGDLFLRVSVEPDPDMILEDRNVISSLSITLLEALTGTVKKVRTVKGEVSLKVKPKIKHREKLSLRGYGVNGADHLFVIDIQYPEDCTKIIELLKEGKNV